MKPYSYAVIMAVLLSSCDSYEVGNNTLSPDTELFLIQDLQFTNYSETTENNVNQIYYFDFQDNAIAQSNLYLLNDTNFTNYGPMYYAGVLSDPIESENGLQMTPDGYYQIWGNSAISGIGLPAFNNITPEIALEVKVSYTTLNSGDNCSLLIMVDTLQNFDCAGFSNTIKLDLINTDGSLLVISGNWKQDNPNIRLNVKNLTINSYSREERWLAKDLSELFILYNTDGSPYALLANSDENNAVIFEKSFGRLNVIWTRDLESEINYYNNESIELFTSKNRDSYFTTSGYFSTLGDAILFTEDNEITLSYRAAGLYSSNYLHDYLEYRNNYDGTSIKFQLLESKSEAVVNDKLYPVKIHTNGLNKEYVTVDMGSTSFTLLTHDFDSGKLLAIGDYFSNPYAIQTLTAK